MNVLYSSTQMHYMFGAFTFVTFQKEFNSFMHFHFTSPEQSHRSVCVYVTNDTIGQMFIGSP